MARDTSLKYGIRVVFAKRGEFDVLEGKNLLPGILTENLFSGSGQIRFRAPFSRNPGRVAATNSAALTAPTNLVLGSPEGVCDESERLCSHPLFY